MPHYPLAEVCGCAQNGDVDLEDGPAEARLRAHGMTVGESYAFAKEVACLLRPSDFVRTVQLEWNVADEYAITLRNSVLVKYGQQDRTTWYVKLYIDDIEDEKRLVYVSLHRLEVVATLSTGVKLTPTW